MKREQPELIDEETWDLSLREEVFRHPELLDRLIQLTGEDFELFFEFKASVKVRDE